MGNPARRSFFAPETLQISAMDCGPATLSTFLAGYGIDPGYERLRRLCQTDVDGTSIEALEEICQSYGIDAQQHVVPADAFCEVLDERYPIIAVLQKARLAHFVIIWRRLGPFLQIMDPAGGRRWVRASEFEEQLLVHPLYLPRETWTQWMEGGNLFREQLERRARALVPERAESLLAPLASAPDPHYVGALDAALRLVARTQQVTRKQPREWRQTLFDRAFAAAMRDDQRTLPAAYFAVSVEGDEVRTVGAVMLAPEKSPAPLARPVEPSSTGESPPTTTASRRASLVAELRALIGRDGDFLVKTLALCALVLVVASALELVIYRTMLDAPRLFSTVPARLEVLGFIVVPALLILVIELAATRAAKWLGRRVELELRMATAYSLPRVDDDFVRSRPTTDLAVRAHRLGEGGQLPASLLQAFRATGDLAITLVAIAWVDPTYLLFVGVGGGALLLSFAIARSRLRELDTRNHIHASRLLTLFLDVLRGLRPLRLHGFEDAFRIDQREELGLWRETGLSLLRTRTLLEVATGTTSTLLLVSVFLCFVATHGAPRTFILLAFWTFRIPPLLRALQGFAERLPMQRLTLDRLLEVTKYRTNVTAPVASDIAPGGVRIELRDVCFRASGVDVLQGVSLAVRAGEHVAVVGRSGSGKSTLVQLLLGIVRPSAGTIEVDGKAFDPDEAVTLRRTTAWIDPSVQLWDASVRDNLHYATDGLPRRPFLDVAERTNLVDVLDHLDRGLDTSVGPEGNELSGGEGQRLRVARALLRDGVRFAVLDEAFRGLDRDSRAEQLRNARELCAGATLFYVTHDLEHALGFDRVIVMEGGALIEDGAPAELAARASRFAQLLAAGRQAQSAAWGARMWRRVRVEAARIVEETERG